MGAISRRSRSIPRTGVVEVVKYVSVNDFGNVVNPMVVEGQLHGGVVQGIGQALMEHTVYDDAGQLLTGSFMDYAMPRADRFCPFVLGETRCPRRPIRSASRAPASWTVGALSSVMNAVMAALADRGIRHVDMPLGPFQVWQAAARRIGGGQTARRSGTSQTLMGYG